MTSDQLNGIIRSGLAFAGGIVVAKGWMDAQTMNMVAGSLAPILVAAWSVASKRKPA